jgi:hypothetical protein
MSPEQVARTLAMFDAFLAHARGAASPTSSAHPPLTEVSTAVTAVRGPGAVAEAVENAVPDGEVTRVTAMPLATADRTGRTAAWDEPTHERPDVMRALAKSDAAQPDTDQNIALPKPPASDPRVEQASIIIEDDSLTEPEFRREDVLRAMAEHARPRVEEPASPRPAPPPAPTTQPPPPPAAMTSVEEFATEMLVLVKYDHAAQAVAEIARRVQARPGDGDALATVALAVSRAASRAARRG